MIEHCVSSEKGCGFNSHETHILTKKFTIWLHCKSLWIIASAKCIHLNLHLFALKRSWLHRDVKYLLLRFKGLLVKVMWCNTYSELVLCIYPIQSAPTQQWTHTPGAVGSSWGFGALLLKVARALYIHSPHLHFPPDWDSKLATFRHESDSNHLGPVFPFFRWSYFQGMHMLKINIFQIIYTLCVCLHVHIIQVRAGHEWSLWWGSQLTREPTKVSEYKFKYMYI